MDRELSQWEGLREEELFQWEGHSNEEHSHWNDVFVTDEYERQIQTVQIVYWWGVWRSQDLYIYQVCVQMEEITQYTFATHEEFHGNRASVRVQELHLWEEEGEIFLEVNEWEDDDGHERARWDTEDESEGMEEEEEEEGQSVIMEEQSADESLVLEEESAEQSWVLEEESVDQSLSLEDSDDVQAIMEGESDIDSDNDIWSEPLPSDVEWDEVSVLELPSEENKSEREWRDFVSEGLPVPVPRQAWVEDEEAELCSPGPLWASSPSLDDQASMESTTSPIQSLHGQPSVPRKRPSRFRRALRALRGLFRCPCLRPQPEE